jgi:thiol-disulfide isomerase/thioredoxin
MNSLWLRAGLAAWGLVIGALGCARRSEPRELVPVSSASEAGGRGVVPASTPAPELEQPSPVVDHRSERALRRITADSLRAVMAAAGRRATLVNVWASWCGPCRRELPMLQALSINLKPQGVEIVLVSVDEPKDEPKAISYLRDNGITLGSYVVDGSIADFKLGLNPAWPGMLPASFLFDGGARLVHFWGGEAFENELTPIIEAFLAGRPVPAETRYGLAPGKLE